MFLAVPTALVAIAPHVNIEWDDSKERHKAYNCIMLNVAITNETIDTDGLYRFIELGCKRTGI